MTDSRQPSADPLEPLLQLGLDDRVRELYEPMAGDGFVLGRVGRVDRGGAVVLLPEPLRAEPAWHLAKAADEGSLPAVGDWVAVNDDPGLETALIEVVLPRASAFSRRDPGKGAIVQVLATNVDTLFIVHAISAEPNLARIERELTLAWEGGATPVVVLTKVDLCGDPEPLRELVAEIAIGAEVLLASPVTGYGMEEIRARVPEGRTAALIGPSGVGKSTLVNRLLGEERQATREVRALDDKGRHTTIARELIPIPGAGVLIDTPGMRAMPLWDADEGLALAFADIEELAGRCRFRDCAHEAEPGCAVREALDTGGLAVRRLESYHKLHRELERLAEQQGERLRAERKRETKTVHKASRSHLKQERGGE